MSEPQDTLIIDVEYNLEDEEYGAMYVATNDMIGLVTDGKTFEELRANLAEAIDACLGGIDTIAAYNLTPNPRIEIKLSLPYAEIA